MVAAQLHNRLNSYEIGLSESLFTHCLFTYSQARHWAGGASYGSERGELLFASNVMNSPCWSKLLGWGLGVFLDSLGSSPIPGIICGETDEDVLFASHLIHLCEAKGTPACVAQVVSDLKRKAVEPPLSSSPPQTVHPLAQWMSGGPCKCGWSSLDLQSELVMGGYNNC